MQRLEKQDDDELLALKIESDVTWFQVSVYDMLTVHVDQSSTEIIGK